MRPKGSVVIGASTYDLIREQAVVRPLGSPQLKGKSQSVEVYELLGLRNGAGSASAVDVELIDQSAEVRGASS
jgi:class 3 adenylate cyclase